MTIFRHTAVKMQLCGIFLDTGFYDIYFRIGEEMMNETFMKERPVLPLIFSMALPMVVSMLVNSLYNIVDSFFVRFLHRLLRTVNGVRPELCSYLL